MNLTVDLETSDSPTALREMLTLALPTVAQMASYTVMQFCDAWMLSRATRGIDGPTAVGNAGLLAFSLISFGIGVLWVVNTLVSQSFGRRAFADCGRYLWQGVWFGIGFAVVLAAIVPVFNPAFRLMGHEPALVAMEDMYLKIVLGAAIFKLLGATFSQFLLAIDRPMMVFGATFLGVAVNALAAWIMVFGRAGVSPMGVRGTAWAQNIGVAVETGVLVICALLPGIGKRFGLADWKFRWPEMKTLIFVGAPAGVQIVADVLAWSLFGMWVIARFGTEAMAGQNFMMQYMKVSFMPAFGISVAVTALVGRYIGMGRPDIAEARANLGFFLCAAYMVSCGVLFVIFRHPLIALFTADPLVQAYGSKLLIFAAIYQFFDALYIVYNGALRGAGDTFVPAVATAVLNWTITVGAGYCVARFLPRFGIAGPWTTTTCYGVTLGAFIWLRFRRGKWRAIRIGGHSNVQKPSATLAGTIT